MAMVESVVLRVIAPGFKDGEQGLPEQLAETLLG